MILLMCLFIGGLLWLFTDSVNENPYAPLGITDTEKEAWEEYQQNTSNIAPVFTANQIITFYNTAPHKWAYTLYCGSYKGNEEYVHYPHICYERRTEIAIDNIQDFVVVTRYFNKIIAERNAKEAAEVQERERIRQEKQRYENTLALLPKLREDARRAEEEANQMMEKCERETKEIAARLQAREG